MSEQDLHILRTWVVETLGASSSGESPALEPVAGDASARRSFRVRGQWRPCIAVLAPPETEKNREFLAVRAWLAQAGIRVPALLGADLARGFMLLEDLGQRLLLPELSAATADHWYGKAGGVLLQLARAGAPAAGWPTYDRALLQEELGRFGRWFSSALLQAGEVPDEVFAPFAELLVANALEQPQVLVHRDFHSRNLMVTPVGELALIDFQDAVVGPVTYDAVSLWRDCYIRWEDGQVRRWALAHRDALQREGMMQAVADAQFMRWFDLMGLQRHIKVLGTFARLYLRDGKPGYLDDLPLVLDYSLQVLSQYAAEEPAAAAFAEWFGVVLQPRIARSDWARP